MRYFNLSLFVAMAMAVMFLPATSHAASNEVPNLVQQGIEAFQAKQYDEATQAFDEALKLKPDDPRILFDLGCVKSAQGKYDEAIKLLKDASLTDDTELAIKCHYNLGQIAVDRAKAVLGEKPEDAKPEARTKALTYINQAIIDYSTCLEMNPDHPNARHNLELLRIWQKNMKQVWQEKDRAARRKSMDLPKFVGWLEKEQRALRKTGGHLQAQRRSPKRRLALEDTSTTQRQLSEEITPLKQKITNMLSAAKKGQAPGAPGQMMPGAPGQMLQGAQPGMPPAQPAIPPEQREQVIKALHDLADAAGKSMTTASQCLNERMLDDASDSQGESIEQVNQIGAIIMPYPNLVKKAVAEQRQLTGQSKQQITAADTQAMDQGLAQAQQTTPSGAPEALPEALEAIEESGNIGSETNAVEATTLNPSVSPTDAVEQPPGPPALPTFDPDEAAWQQRFVERWSHLIVDKARQGLKNLPPEEPKKPEEKKPVPEDKTATEPPKPLTPQEQAAKEAKEKQEGLRESMRRAVKLGPKVVQLTKEASELLDQNNVDEAVPRQKEALVLLEKIAEPLKDKNKQDQNKDQNKNQDKKQNKDKDKNKNKDKDKKDQNKQGPPPPPKPKKGNQPPKAQPKPMDPSKRQAEAMIREVKKRQENAKKIRALLQEKAYGPRKVQKDW